MPARIGPTGKVRNLANWCAYISRSTNDATYRRGERMLNQEKAGKRTTVRGMTLKTVAYKKQHDFTRQERNILTNIISDTALKNLGAKQLFSAKDFITLQKITRQLLRSSMENDNPSTIKAIETINRLSIHEPEFADKLSKELDALCLLAKKYTKNNKHWRREMKYKLQGPNKELFPTKTAKKVR
jgi:hypothetical protein